MNPPSSTPSHAAAASAAPFNPRLHPGHAKAAEAFGSSAKSPQSSADPYQLPHPGRLPAQIAPGSPSHGFDGMWQQKLGANPWMLNHLEEMRLERERSLSHEREQQKRLESHKEDEMEKERQREWRERDEQERLEREERERAQREAVQQHFEESLRLALQKQKITGWNPQSSSKNVIGKGRESSPVINTQSTPPVQGSDSERQRDISKERTQYMNSNYARREREKWLAIVQQQRNEQPTSASNFTISERSVRSLSKGETQQIPFQGSASKIIPSPSPISSSTSQVKNETNFSLYGYQPFQHTYITHAQLKAREENKATSRSPSIQTKVGSAIKNEKDVFLEQSSSPDSIETMSHVSSKQLRNGQDKTGIVYHPLVGGGAFKPYEYSNNNSSAAPPAHQSAPVQNIAHYQLLQDEPQNLVKGDGKGLHDKIISTQKYSKETKLVTPSVNSSTSFTSLSSSSKNIAPISTTNQYSYSLIQQGLVPNPLYTASSHGGTSNTTPVPYVLSQTSKLPTHSGNPSAAPIQYSRASPSTTISSVSSVCRTNSTSYTLPTGHINHNFMSIGSPGSSNSAKLIANQEPHLSNRTQIPVHAPSPRSPSPAHLYAAQSNQSNPNSPHQSTPRVTSVPIHASVHLSDGNASSPFLSNLHMETPESSAIPLVKRKLLSDDVSRKRPKSDDSLLPPQLQPQVQTVCTDSNESQIVAPPILVSNAPLLSKSCVSGDLFPCQVNPSSINMISTLIPKPVGMSLKMESSVPSLMPNLSSTPLMNSLESHSDSEYFARDTYNSPLKKQKTLNRSVADATSHLTDSVEKCMTSQAISNSETKDVSSCYSDYTNNSSNNASSFHPKLKKAWLQRHSENEDKKTPAISNSDLKPDSCSNIKIEGVKMKIEDNDSKIDSIPIKADMSNKHVEDTKAKSFEIKTDISETKNDLDEGDFLNSESDGESDSKSDRQDMKLNNKYSLDLESQSSRLKSGNDTDSINNEMSKKDKDLKRKPSSITEKDLKKKGRRSKGRNVILDENSKKRGVPKPALVASKPSDKPSIAQLRKTGEPFLQDGPCCEIAPRLPKCRECRMTPHQRSKKMPNIFCRFYAYRKLRYGKNGTILSAGFSEPSDALEEDLKLWLPPADVLPLENEIETSKFLLTHIGDQFCDLVEMEKEAQKMHVSSGGLITWKRVVQGVREMCDVCEATLFNIHWVCHKCGFVVCIDCYKIRKNGFSKVESSKDRDDYQWLYCSNRQPHEQEKLMLTQIIAGSALWDVGKSLHEIRKKWNIPTYCKCGINECDQDGKNSSNGICKLMSAVTKCFSSDKESTREGNGSSDIQKSSKKNKNPPNGIKTDDGVGGYSSESGGSPLSWLADVALNSSKISDDQKEKEDEEKSVEDFQSHVDAASESDDDKSENFSTLRELLIRPTGKMGGKNNGSSSSSQKTLTSTLDEVISCVIEQKVRKSDKKSQEKQLLHFTRRYEFSHSGRELPPVRTCFIAETSLLYPEIPHIWLGSGKILLLKNPYDAGNLQMFQEQWKRGQPIVVADIGKNLDSSLWTPESFLKEFGDQKFDFINCLGGTLLQGQLMKKFWDGFENASKRMKDDDGEALVLKLVDWPPAEEFSDILPTRYDDLMKALPLPQYTHPEGVLNMASHLPHCFVQPDLGPKMYNAYGLSSSLGKGSANLHIDTSDSVHLLAYVAIPKDVKEEVMSRTLKALEDCGCDSLMKQRAKGKGSKPGAVWHIFNARDADKIRDFLNKVSEEQGVKRNPYYDAIHNQEWYLDERLRSRLQKEYGVEPYTIAQCSGDAIFIPAGSPYQVLNLYSCVKVSEDFISPESVAHSFFLTQEIRNLSDSPINIVDRLQIKNIIYHAVKDALALLQSYDPEDSKT